LQRLLLLRRANRAAAAALVFAGCGGEAATPAVELDAAESDIEAEADVSWVPDDASPDIASIEAGGSSWTVPTFELGTNEQGKATPKDFVPLLTGDTLPVVLGPQGLSMVVLAFRTCGLYAPPLLLRARIATDDDAASGALDIARQKLNPAPDGLSYYYNFWLVVENPERAGGKMADIILDVEDAMGAKGTHSLRVALTGP